MPSLINTHIAKGLLLRRLATPVQGEAAERERLLKASYPKWDGMQAKTQARHQADVDDAMNVTVARTRKFFGVREADGRWIRFNVGASKETKAKMSDEDKAELAAIQAIIDAKGRPVSSDAAPAPEPESKPAEVVVQTRKPSAPGAKRPTLTTVKVPKPAQPDEPKAQA